MTGPSSIENGDNMSSNFPAEQGENNKYKKNSQEQEQEEEYLRSVTCLWTVWLKYDFDYSFRLSLCY